MYINKLTVVLFHDLSHYGYPAFISDKKLRERICNKLTVKVASIVYRGAISVKIFNTKDLGSLQEILSGKKGFIRKNDIAYELLIETMFIVESDLPRYKGTRTITFSDPIVKQIEDFKNEIC